ncbi:orc1/cdc6 family replication initiation protein [Natronolimnohabitans sp. A-GB9]|uniref:Cdc6/Cdc18 family protein n=1 Tax=Natronolimnohabitans sp. A-GB9 TaxID=3069757 RepID=UPI0027AF8DAB|nr:orc1/cdc6 family replication initiation protein [Natronolimnohabitans sp. A-GB9]MDQ2049641.1 orc1/cdc6 family replication initiation protein [Natronolimnohabitans sp. A-GB9]
MGKFDFTPGNYPFRNRNALLDDYTPEEMVGRDAELEEYHGALQPAINQSQPDNIFLYGKTGVGKTAATKFLLDRLETASEQHNVTITSKVINCDGIDTSYRVGVELVNTFSSDKISETGHPRSKVYDLMWDTFDDLGGLIILVLDEIDHLQDDSLLYQLSRARENDNIENARVSVVGISNDLNYRDTLSPKVRSSLCERSINFPAYTANELEKVLHQRKEIAFQEDVLDSGVIQLCAAFGAQESGDARKALDLLLKAGDLAHEEDADQVTEDHVRRGRGLLQREEVTRGILGLNEHEQILLYALASFNSANSGPVRSRDLYRRYEGFCERAARDALTSRWMHDHLDEMEMLGLVNIEKRNEGSTGGQYKVVALDQEPPAVLDALNDTIEQVGVHQSVQTTLKDL